MLKNPAKEPWFTGSERAAFIAEATGNLANVEVSVFDGLTVAHAKARGADLIVRGLRAVMDYDYEVQMALMNRHMAPDIETLFMLTAAPCAHISSSMVKQVALFGVPLEGLVPEPVARALRQKCASPG